ncbi:hypothetical protein Tsubulata_008438 [Turnera subulata]|uniref:Uncharacterized protein n=1 Tax=Turnera subulata TaxID=218843 RepID=A0A9Q0FUL9_9ROSI|nr:hypothetical protein Tsubulata_008438 [Turnera subulata]
MKFSMDSDDGPVSNANNSCMEVDSVLSESTEENKEGKVKLAMEFKCCVPFDPGGSWKHKKLLGLQQQFSKFTRDLLHDSQDWGSLNVDTRVASGTSFSQVDVSKVNASSKIKIQVNAFVSGSIPKVGDHTINDCGTLTNTGVFELFAATKDFETQFCFAARKQLISSGNNKLDDGLIFRLSVRRRVMLEELQNYVFDLGGVSGV